MQFFTALHPDPQLAQHPTSQTAYATGHNVNDYKMERANEGLFNYDFSIFVFADLFIF